MIASAALTTRKNSTPSIVDRDVVAGDHLLLGDVDRQDAGVDHPDLVDQRDDQEQAGPLDLLELAQPEHDGSSATGRRAGSPKRGSDRRPTRWRR